MDVLSALVFFAYAPALVILWYFYHADKFEPEPKKYVIGTFILGGTLSVGIAYILEMFLTIGGRVDPVLPMTAFYVALVAGIVEEPAKSLAIRWPFKAGQMDGIMDGLVYGVAAGLGFAATENFLYGLGYGIPVTIVRGFLTPFAHATWSAIIGVGYGMKAEGKVDSVGPFFLLAIILHFVWDYYAFLSYNVAAYHIMLILFIMINLAILRYFLLMGQAEDASRVWYYWFRRGGYE
ncbi:PrsW family intramembrane metalloprotease [Thermococcus sp. GR7]|uniref:PrsW family intramembrane metalloprotease n=1 Tax=unclassified Thermococcus TaxID=2627626 RepID=UPI00142F9D6F|nr:MULTISPECIES: PrsW family glutamic-type intramembrane protease [unclassified Thermococcus]NJE46968.1 PrsW family intramembrane metalloprotease [Thermococcus sp. GR7]NJE78980.1 PrsW family intramembrane metalloprotease [Thermococcus sp. GR4]NJF22676.1 PrsW family intramembrane metalloprotease [Thermococcus sp. GR5]